jgi:hypothetical protein
MVIAISISSGCTSWTWVGVTSAGEIISRVRASGLQCQLRLASYSRGQPATSSPQAPAALTSTPAWNTAPALVFTRRTPPLRSIRWERRRNATTAPRARAKRR